MTALTMSKISRNWFQIFMAYSQIDLMMGTEIFFSVLRAILWQMALICTFYSTQQFTIAEFGHPFVEWHP
jgi:hypothetical protein